MPTVCSLMRTSRGPSASSRSIGKSRKRQLVLFFEDECLHAPHVVVPQPFRMIDDAERHRQDVADQSGIDCSRKRIQNSSSATNRCRCAMNSRSNQLVCDRQKAVTHRRGGREAGLVVGGIEIDDRLVHHPTP